MLHLAARFLLLLAYLTLLTACGSGNGNGLLFLDPGPDQSGPSALVTNDPAGPIPAPQIPTSLTEAVFPAVEEELAADTGAEGTKTPALAYTVAVVTPVPELEEAFLGAARLETMRATPLDTVTGLEQRMRHDLELAKDVLHAYGYYSGEVHGRIRRERLDGEDPAPRRERRAHREAAETAAQREATARPERGDGEVASARRERREGEGGSAWRRRTFKENAYVVTITFEPGEQYAIGTTKVMMLEPFQLKVDANDSRRRLPPTSLADVGVKQGDPAIADTVLDAVSAARESFRDRGYPYAKTASQRYVVDHERKTLDADIVIDSGPLVYMGDLVITGDSPVRPEYVQALATWKPGRVWSQRRVDRFRDKLRQSGLFTSAEIQPADQEDENGRRDVVTELFPAPPRTVGGALKFDTDFGPGIQGYWENRNLTNRGDKLRVEAPIWADFQELGLSYRLPFFLRDDQDLIVNGGVRSEDTDAYELQSARASIGLERQLSRRWRGTLSVMGEGGSLKDPDEPKRDYLMAGLPGSLAYDGANSLLDATKGYRASINLAPYVGEYNDSFTVLRSRLEAQAFFPVMKEDKLILAVRAMYGFVYGEDADNLPASIRFYTGGGGSVRGYSYQSLGPRNSSDDPLGGASAIELSAEARYKLNETWGVVAFVDGGMAYNDQTPDFGQEELRWGAGLGVRFYTAIGPIRLDVAVPLNPRSDDDDFQVYFSIGQSF